MAHRKSKFDCGSESFYGYRPEDVIHIPGEPGKKGDPGKNIKGDKGDKGDQGNPGPAGPTGGISIVTAGETIHGVPGS